MRRVCSILTIAVLAATPVAAQKHLGRKIQWWLAGSSDQPVGAFSVRSGQSSLFGHARAGGGFMAGATYPVGKGWLAGAQISFSFFGVDTVPVQNALRASYQLSDAYYKPRPRLTKPAANLYSLHGGRTFPAGKLKIDVVANLGLGLYDHETWFQVERKAIGSNFIDTVKLTVANREASYFQYGSTLSAAYPLYKTLHLIGRLSYATGQARINATERIGTLFGEVTEAERSYIQPVSTVSFSLGFQARGRWKKKLKTLPAQ